MSVNEVIIEGECRRPSKNAPRYFYKGQLLTAAELHKLAVPGLVYETLIDRLKKGWPAQKAINTPARPRKKLHSRFFYKGEPYTLAELARRPECQVTQRTLRNRLVLLKWDVEKAVETPTDTKLFEYKGEKYSMAELSRRPECKVSYNTLCSRLVYSYWDVERAVETPPKY
jgi:lambda repressor-like predicted transcriptional regulator